MLARFMLGAVMATLAVPAAAADPVMFAPAAVSGPPARINYSLAPGRAALPLMRVQSDRYDRALGSEGEPAMIRDRFDARALRFESGPQLRRRESITAGLQLRLTGDARGMDTSLDVAGPASAIMRHALR